MVAKKEVEGCARAARPVGVNAQDEEALHIPQMSRC